MNIQKMNMEKFNSDCQIKKICYNLLNIEEDLEFYILDIEDFIKWLLYKKMLEFVDIEDIKFDILDIEDFSFLVIYL